MVEWTTRVYQTTPGYVRPVRLILYGLLFAAVLLTFTGFPALERAVREGRQPPFILMLAPAVLASFIALFATYRFALVRAKRYPAGKAFMQIGLMVLILTLVLPGSLERYHAITAVKPVSLERWLGAANPDVRAMAAELARHREKPAAVALVPGLLKLLDDPSIEVRRQAHTSLTAIAGRDAGGEGPDRSDRWRAFWQQHGTPTH